MKGINIETLSIQYAYDNAPSSMKTQRPLYIIYQSFTGHKPNGEEIPLFRIVD
jgi:hypothetical protein